MTKIFPILICLFCLLFPLQGSAWSKPGHRIIAKIAQIHLTPDTAKKLEKLLGPMALERLCNWMDELRADNDLRSPSYKWHFINLPEGDSYQKIPSEKTYEQVEKMYPGETYEEIQRGKNNKQNLKGLHTKGDLYWATNHFIEILKNKKEPTKRRIEALKFLDHLIGDFHMPLHCGYPSDKGGNKISLQWFGKKTSLHAVWDYHLIESEGLSYTEYANILMADPALTSHKKQWQKESPDLWLDECLKNRASLYTLVNDPKYQKRLDQYRLDYKELLSQSLYKAGIRLAYILNNSL